MHSYNYVNTNYDGYHFTNKVAADLKVAVDLKQEFETYLAAADINEGAIPDDVEVQVGSRVKIWAAGTHTDVGYMYAHPNINGRPRYDAEHAHVALR